MPRLRKFAERSAPEPRAPEETNDLRVCGFEEVKTMTPVASRDAASSVLADAVAIRWDSRWPLFLLCVPPEPSRSR